jgi:hypothetical protein
VTVGTGVRVVTVVSIIVTGVFVTGAGAGVLVIHPATRSRNTRAATVKTNTGYFPAPRDVLFMDLFFIIIPIYPWENGDLYLRNHPVTQMEVNKDTVMDTFGKNGQAQKICRTLFITTAILVRVEVVDLATAQRIIGIMPG